MRKVRDSCGKSVSGGDPAGLSRGPTARGKRVPEAEINVQIRTSKKNCRQTRFSSSCLQCGASG
ncbi:hypothetical protein ACQKOM_19760 [Peribacillus frigoritolerans]|uniref:hypothetical protein n=1 Tax=Peribacillus frigoritolerans TaxID=450367 RepID=UPI003CFE1F82